MKKSSFTEAMIMTDTRDPQEEALSLLAEALAHIERSGEEQTKPEDHHSRGLGLPAAS